MLIKQLKNPINTHPPFPQTITPTALRKTFATNPQNTIGKHKYISTPIQIRTYQITTTTYIYSSLLNTFRFCKNSLIHIYYPIKTPTKPTNDNFSKNHLFPSKYSIYLYNLKTQPQLAVGKHRCHRIRAEALSR